MFNRTTCKHENIIVVHGNFWFCADCKTVLASLCDECNGIGQRVIAGAKLGSLLHQDCNNCLNGIIWNIEAPEEVT